MKIKKIRISLAIFIFASLVFSVAATKNALAGKASLSWTAPTTNSDGSALTDLGGYKVYWGTSARSGESAPGGYLGSQDVGNVTTYTVDNIADTGTTYFSVTAKDSSNPANESAFSNEAHKTPGDMNNSGTVNMSDFNVLAINFNQVVPNCSQSGNYNQADVNLDCTVNMSDFNALALNFGYSIN